MTKTFWHSKTLWVNALMGIALIVQAATGTAWLDTEAQGAIVVIVNLILRIITKQGLSIT